jgi:4-hydroxybenzoyl-CoA thioesterase
MKEVAPFVHAFVVRFADVDHAKIVYYPMFYHYFHVAFEELFRERMGAEAYLDLLDNQKIGFPAVHSECDYSSPLRFADSAETEISLDRIGTKSVSLQYVVNRVEGQERSLAAKGKVVCAVTDLVAFRAVEIPAQLRPLFLELSRVVG